MPYCVPRFLSSTTPQASLPLPIDTKEEFQERLTELIFERDTWKSKSQMAELEVETLKGEMEQKDHLLLTQSRQIIEKNDLLRRKYALLGSDSKRKKRHMDWFSGSQSDSDDAPASEV
jgi:hypothetical protein